MVIAGIDYSMTSPAMTIIDSNKEFKFENLNLFYLTNKQTLAKSNGNIHGFLYPEWSCHEERYYKVTNIFMDILTKFNVESAMIEGYSYGSSKGLAFNIAENGGIFKHYVWLAGIKMYEIAPQSVKKKATGSGRADKTTMVEKFYEQIFTNGTLNDAIGIKSKKLDAKPIDDLVDSVWITKAFYDEKTWKTE